MERALERSAAASASGAVIMARSSKPPCSFISREARWPSTGNRHGDRAPCAVSHPTRRERRCAPAPPDWPRGTALRRQLHPRLRAGALPHRNRFDPGRNPPLVARGLALAPPRAPDRRGRAAAHTTLRCCWSAPWPWSPASWPSSAPPAYEPPDQVPPPGEGGGDNPTITPRHPLSRRRPTSNAVAESLIVEHELAKSPPGAGSRCEAFETPRPRTAGRSGRTRGLDRVGSRTPALPVPAGHPPPTRSCSIRQADRIVLLACSAVGRVDRYRGKS